MLLRDLHILSKKVKINLIKFNRLRSDNGGEYQSLIFDFSIQFFFVIIHRLAPPYSLTSNGIADRKNMNLID